MKSSKQKSEPSQQPYYRGEDGQIHIRVPNLADEKPLVVKRTKKGKTEFETIRPMTEEEEEKTAPEPPVRQKLGDGPATLVQNFDHI